MFRTTMLIALFLQLVGCGTNGGTQPEGDIEVGQLAYQDGQPQIQVPAVGHIGTPVVVSVITVGDGCVSMESTDAAPSSDGIDVTPFDRRRTPDPDEGCVAIERHFNHEVSLSFDTTGPTAVRVHGRAFDADGEQFVEFPFTIMIE